MTRLLLCSALTLLAMAPALEAGAQPFGVFVNAVANPPREKPSEADRQRASASYDAVDTARKALEKTLKAQYGKKRDKWPAEAETQLANAEVARDRLNAEWQYRTDAEPVTAEWRDGIARALTQEGGTGRKEHITSVPTEAQAQLIVTLTAVRNPSAATNAADDRCVLVRLTHGPKLPAELFARVPRGYRPRRVKALRLAAPDEGSPFWQFEGCGLHPYFSTEESVANLVNDFVGAHRDVLLASPRP
jgi:hypothetical protein